MNGCSDRRHRGFAMDIQLHGLSKVYRVRVRALDQLDLEIASGMFGLLGPNGARKTTLMRILAGILRPNSSTVTVGGGDCATEGGRTGIKRLIGDLPEERGFYPHRSAS